MRDFQSHQTAHSEAARWRRRALCWDKGTQDKVWWAVRLFGLCFPTGKASRPDSVHEEFLWSSRTGKCCDFMLEQITHHAETWEQGSAHTARGPNPACTALKLRMAYAFLKSCKNKPTDKHINKPTHQIQKRVDDRDYLWPADPKMLLSGPLWKKFADLSAFEDGH